MHIEFRKDLTFKELPSISVVSNGSFIPFDRRPFVFPRDPTLLFDSFIINVSFLGNCLELKQIISLNAKNFKNYTYKVFIRIPFT